MRLLILVLLTISVISLEGQTFDSNAIKQVDSLIKSSRTLTGQRDFDKALEVNAIAERISLELLGRESEGYGSCCHNRGRVNYFKKDNSEAEKWYLEALDIRAKTIGRLHPDYAASLNNLAVLYQEMGNYDKAEPLYFESIAIRKKALGKDHPDYAISLINLASLYYIMGNYDKAEPLYLESIAINEKVIGKEHPVYATSLINLASLYVVMGNYDKAEPLYLESIAINEKAHGKDKPEYATSLNNLAILYKNMGKYDKAEPLYLESKTIREKALGKEHPDYAMSLNSLANFYSDMGKYEKAEPLCLESKAINEKALGKEHTDYAMSLDNLASLYKNMGNYDKAEPLCLESKTIREKALGKENPDYSNSLTNLASLYYTMGKYEKAEPLYLESKAIREKALGKENPDYAMSLNNLAILYSVMGNYDKAELNYLESIAIMEKALGKEHPDYATNVKNLANFYSDIGNYEKAEPLYLEAKAIREKALGKEHPAYAQSLHNIANFYEKQKRYSVSEPLLSELYALEQSRLLKATYFLSERELAKYTATFQTKGDYLGSYILARQGLPGGQTRLPLAEGGLPGTMPAMAYGNALFYKGFLLTAAAQLNTLVASTPEIHEINLRLKSYQLRLAAEYAKPIAKRKNVAELEEKANTAEKELARSMVGYAEAKRQVKWEEVMSALKKDEAAIEFVSFKVNFPKKTDSIMYAALLLKPGTKQPNFILLFEEKSMDSLLHSKLDHKENNVNAMYTLATRGAIPLETSKKSLYESLYDILWKPLEKELKGIKTIYFSPSGVLHRINQDAIPISKTERLSDKYDLIELNSTRQLVIPTQIKKVNNDAVLYGGIQYEEDSILQITEPLIASSSRGELSFTSTDSKLRGGNWNYLAGTEREVNSIDKIMQDVGVKTTLKKGYQATEESFKNMGANNSASPRILHIATHGYFFPDTKTRQQSSAVSPQEETVFKMSEHPMLRSGLIMAGGNAVWHGKQTLDGKEDGILTAYEISQMNLSNTELVVLSACETGLGDIQGNEGVYGLQRAFKIAGAKYLIMSLWQVPDNQTSLLMTTFYKKWLEDKMSIPDAFHAAQKELRDMGLDPYQWAGFVLVE